MRYAQQLFERGDIHKRIRAKGFEKIFAVFDRDDHQSYFDALKISESLDQKLRNDANQRVAFRAIASVPCFELWLLLHFEDVQHLLHRDEILRRLKQHMPSYSKGAGQSFAATKQCLNLAAQRAKNLNTLSSAFDDTMPSTAIVDLVTLLVEFEN